MRPTNSIFDFPDVYDAVLRSPPEQIEAEVHSIRGLLSGRDITKGRILDIGCGTCPHGILLTQHGFSVTGIDVSDGALEGAKRRAASAGVDIELIKADVVDFSLDAEPFDCAIFMSETFPLITEYDELESHFRAVRRHVKVDGLYVIDIDSHERGIGTAYEVWGRRTVPLENGSVHVWHESFPGDWVRGTSRVTMHCRIEIGDAMFETTDEWEWRADSPWNLSVLVKSLEDWSLKGFFSWRDLSQDIAKERHYFMVLQ